jgi:uncharacterized protein
MLINIKDLAITGNTRHITEQIDLTDVLNDRKDLLGFSPLKAELKAKYATGAVQVEGELYLEVDVPCSRCLKPLREHITIPFHEVFARKDADVQDEEEDDTIFVAQDRVDLNPYLMEHVVLSLPFVPLCGEECKGLCPVCGVNRNETACPCKQEKIDPRLAGLADFFKD